MRTSIHPSRLASWLLAGSALVLGTSLAAAAIVRQDPLPRSTSAQDAGQSDEDLATIGVATVQAACASQCHGADSLDQRRTTEDWNSVIEEMVDRGAVVTDADLAIVRRYLARYYGLVAVNTAKAEELAAVLGLSLENAKAIVEYRTAHGTFADAAALAKVPGIDTRKINEQPDALRFK